MVVQHGLDTVRDADTLILSAYVYYHTEETPLLTDTEFDALVEIVCKNWGDLLEYQKDTLRSPAELQTTSYYIQLPEELQPTSHYIRTKNLK